MYVNDIKMKQIELSMMGGPCCIVLVADNGNNTGMSEGPSNLPMAHSIVTAGVSYLPSK
jgi:hypothetical protein